MTSKQNQMQCDRRLHWMSSVSGDASVLSNLNQQMAWFYGRLKE